MDVSGSMQPADRLPLVKNAFRMLVDELQPDDTVAIVTYASGSGICLEPTKIADKAKILAAIDRLGAGGSTAGAEGIQDAYRLAESNFDKAAVNRVILATDGDFNVGVTNQDELKGLIERKRDKGIFLSILGVGQGNYNDSLMQTLGAERQRHGGVCRYVERSAQGAGRRGLLDALHHRQGREDPDRVEPAACLRVSSRRLRDARVEARGFQQRSCRCRRHRLRPHRDGDLRSDAGRRGADGRQSALRQGAEDGLRRACRTGGCSGTFKTARSAS